MKTMGHMMTMMNKLWDIITYPYKMVWNSLFDNDAGKIVSKRGQEVLSKQKQKEYLIQLTNIDLQHEDKDGRETA